MSSHIGALSGSSTLLDKRETSSDQLKWEDIYGFIFLADTFATTGFNYGLFSGVYCYVPIYAFFFFTLLVGMPFMCMDIFIKQYTGRIDFHHKMNPFLKAVNVVTLCQSIAWAIIHSNHLADVVFFLISAFKTIPQWSECSSNYMNISESDCISTKNITNFCEQLLEHEPKININVTSAHHNYRVLFISNDRQLYLTKRIFFIALVWICNFVFNTVSEQIKVKFFSAAYVFRNITTLLAAIFVLFSSSQHFTAALKDILGYKNQDETWFLAAVHVLYIFGVGVVGIYDFGTLSPFMPVDNAVIAFAIAFVTVEMVKDVLVRVIYRLITQCIIVNSQIDYHYLLLVVMPLGADFLCAQKLFTLYLYLNQTITLFPHLAALTGSLTKLLHNEYNIAKEVYISGLICFFGFLVALPLDLRIYSFNEKHVIGLPVCMFVFAALRSGIIMYLYGVNKFSADIHFWLGFKPTKYWTISWSLMPIILSSISIITLSWIPFIISSVQYKSYPGMAWTILCGLLLLVLEIRTILKYVTNNNLTGLFRPSNKYGPPDIEDRNRRMNYDEALSIQRCLHECIGLEEKIDCNHLPLTFNPGTWDHSKEDSIENIFEENASRKHRKSEAMESNVLHD